MNSTTKSRDQKEFENLTMCQNGASGNDKKIIMAKTSSSGNTKLITNNAPSLSSSSFLDGGGGVSQAHIFVESNKQSVHHHQLKEESLNKRNGRGESTSMSKQVAVAAAATVSVNNSSTVATTFPICYWQNYFSSKFNSGKRDKLKRFPICLSKFDLFIVCCALFRFF